MVYLFSLNSEARSRALQGEFESRTEGGVGILNTQLILGEYKPFSRSSGAQKVMTLEEC